MVLALHSMFFNESGPRTAAPPLNMNIVAHFPQFRQVHENLKAQEEAVVGLYLSKGLDITLDAQVSVVNKKIDILLPAGTFSRSKFFAAMKGIKRKKLSNHVICIDRIRANGEGTECSASNIFGRPLVRISC